MESGALSVGALPIAQSGPLHGVRTRRIENGIMTMYFRGEVTWRGSVPPHVKTVAQLSTTSVATSAPVTVAAPSTAGPVAPVVSVKSGSRRKKSVVAGGRRPITRSMGLAVCTRSQLKAKMEKLTRKF